jgi:predicted metalloprotease
MLEGEESTNIEDRRGMGGRGLAIGGGGIATLLLALVVYMCGGDPSQLLNQIGGGDAPTQTTQQQPQSQQPGGAQPKDSQRSAVASVLKTTEDAWREILPQQARVQYRDPKLVLFTGQTQSACGAASSSTGPFYCPGDEKLYLDFGFFDDLEREFKAPGDFAQAYVVGHEVGHHVQKILGTMDKVNAVQQRSSEEVANQYSVALELQADCYAGVWANYAQKKGRLEVGDVEEALRAASAVGDDSIQKRAQGYVVPESFTHGSSQQRMTWFKRGFDSGDIRQCNTFSSR